MSADFRDTLRRALADADAAFTATGNTLEALGWVALAAKAGAPLPPAIGRWVHRAINDYQAGAAPSLDAAFGLAARGKAQPRRKAQERSRLEAPLARMSVLHTMGGTIEQAAELVAPATGYSVETLIDRYSRSGHGRMALAERPAMLARLTINEARGMLDEYPADTDGAAQAKAAILDLYVKRGI